MKTKAKIPTLALAASVFLAALPLTAMAQGGFGRPGFGGRRPGGSVTWSGTVDETTIVTLHGSDVRTQVVSGKSSGDANVQVAGRLPDRPMRLVLRRRQGRGEIRIVQQPNPRNNFTGRVRIHDPQAGSSFYSFVLVWRRAPGAGPGEF